jgi:hypothetical protein
MKMIQNTENVIEINKVLAALQYTRLAKSSPKSPEVL